MNEQQTKKEPTSVLGVRMRKTDKHAIVILAGVENRTWSQMAGILIKEALAARGVKP